MPDPIPSSPHINRPGQLIRNPASSEFSSDGNTAIPRVPSRGAFLGTAPGTRYWCMFMPGQNAKGNGPYDPGGLPTEWPAAGSPLRVPKSVYLTSCPPAHLWGDNFVLMTVWTEGGNGYFGHYDDSSARDTRPGHENSRPASSVPLGSLVFDGFYGSYDYIGWTIDPQYNTAEDGRRKWRRHAKVHNVIVDEHLRLIAEFRVAKEFLERTYPDNVYVTITGFFPEDPVTTIAPRDDRLPKVLDVYTDDGVANNTPTMLCNGPLWLLGPNFTEYDSFNKKDIVPCFGVDFLHIYCGYQANQGFLPVGHTFTDFRDQKVPDISDLTDNRTNWSDSRQGYKLNRDTSFEFGETYWLAQAFDGYEAGPATPAPGAQVLDSYADFKAATTQLMVQSTTVAAGTDHERVQPQGKLDMLKVAWRNFSGYAVSLHEYDLTWDFGSPVTKMKSGAGIVTRFPCYSVVYEDQDWVEQYAFNYATRVSQYGDGAPYHDQCYPGADGAGFPGAVTTSGEDGTGNTGTEGGGDGGGGTFNTGAAYNCSTRFPGTDAYEGPGGYNSQIKWQYDNLKNAMTHAGPKCARMWQELIAENDLGDWGFTYDGGSSAVTAESIIAQVEAHYGLTRPTSDGV